MRSKYGNLVTVLDGHRFDSRLEARRYQELRLLERAGLVAKLEVHPRFELRIGEILICTYTADFRYFDESRRMIVEDVKSEATRLKESYRLKRKLMLAIHGIEVTEYGVRVRGTGRSRIAS
jgi:Protein of unknown function (DUF1064).